MELNNYAVRAFMEGLLKGIEKVASNDDQYKKIADFARVFYPAFDVAVEKHVTNLKKS